MVRSPLCMLVRWKPFEQSAMRQAGHLRPRAMLLIAHWPWLSTPLCLAAVLRKWGQQRGPQLLPACLFPLRSSFKRQRQLVRTCSARSWLEASTSRTRSNASSSAACKDGSRQWVPLIHIQRQPTTCAPAHRPVPPVRDGRRGNTVRCL